MTIAGHGLIGITENRNQPKIKKGPDLQSMLQNKYNFCVCTIYSYHIMQNMLFTLYSQIYMIKTYIHPLYLHF